MEPFSNFELGGVTTGREVIVTSDNLSITVWNLEGSVLRKFKKGMHEKFAGNTIQFLSDSYILCADYEKPRMHIWSLYRGLPLPNVYMPTPGIVKALTCTPNGSYIIAAIQRELYIWQTCNGRLLIHLSQHYQNISSLAITKDGSLFASGGEDGQVFVWSLYRALNNKHSPIHIFTSNMPITDLHIGQGDTRARLYVASILTLKIYELGSGETLLLLPFDIPIYKIAVNILESRLYVGCGNGDILEYDLFSPPRTIEHHIKINEENKFKTNSQANMLSVSINCKTLLAGCNNKTVYIWDIPSRQILGTIQHSHPVVAAFFMKEFDNFHTDTFKPSLEICNLQKTSNDNYKENIIQIISKGRNSAEILNFESYVGGNTESQGFNEMSKKLEDLQKEVERLKEANAAIYKYSIDNILESVANR